MMGRQREKTTQLKPESPPEPPTWPGLDPEGTALSLECGGQRLDPREVVVARAKGSRTPSLICGLVD